MNNDTIKLLNLEQFNLQIKDIFTYKQNNILFCEITLEKNICACPFCNSSNVIVKEYYNKQIKHSISTNNPCFIIYHARRFKCKDCNSTFYEHNPFTNKFDKLSTYTKFAILEALKKHTLTFEAIASNFNVSKNTVINLFDACVDPKRRNLPEVICIDEFYTSKFSQYKYACVFLDFYSSKVIEVYSSRHKNRLSQNLSLIPKTERLNVKYVVIDMWDSYLDLATIYFPNCKVAVDSFHVIKHLNEAINDIRIKIMKKYDKNTDKLVGNDINYYMLKKFHYFFTKNYEDIYDNRIYIKKLKTKWHKDEIRKFLFSIDPDLKEAYFLKESYQEFNKIANYETFDNEFNELLDQFINSKFQEFREFSKLLIHWKDQIKNSFIRYNGRRLSNGPIEGVNSKIKTIFKSANGYKNFNRLRNRIIYSLNKDVPIKIN